MKKEYYQTFTDNELREVRKKLTSSYDVINENLPEDMKVFLEGKSAQTGNQLTRINRCISLLDKECLDRFLKQ